jgi:hypothetical protein
MEGSNHAQQALAIRIKRGCRHLCFDRPLDKHEMIVPANDKPLPSVHCHSMALISANQQTLDFVDC